MYILKRGRITYQFSKANNIGKEREGDLFPYFQKGELIKPLTLNLYLSLDCLDSLMQIQVSL